jgi:hypothetical protein
MLDQHGDARLNEGPRRVAGARLMPGLWQIVQMITHPNGMPGAIVERVVTSDDERPDEGMSTTIGAPLPPGPR